MVTVFHYTLVNAKQFDGLNIDGLAGKHQKHQNFPPVKILHYTVFLNLLHSKHCCEMCLQQMGLQ